MLEYIWLNNDEELIKQTFTIHMQDRSKSPKEIVNLVIDKKKK